jgi:hypothetical protein
VKFDLSLSYRVLKLHAFNKIDTIETTNFIMVYFEKTLDEEERLSLALMLQFR